MTVTAPPEGAPYEALPVPPAEAAPSPESQPPAAPQARRPADFTPARIALVVLAWLGATLAVIVLVLYGMGPMLEQRDQSRLLDHYRTEVRQAANESGSFYGVQTPTQAPSTGGPVAILEINALHLRQVAVEGVGPQQTRQGPGHAPGTAGVGQPGNSVVVARRLMFGGPFRHLGELEKGDRMVATTTQGQSEYVVRQVRTVTIADADPNSATPQANTSGTTSDETSTTPMKLEAKMTPDELYGPTPTDQLTLVTSESASPWASGRATVVVASMRGRPFEPTPQGGRTGANDGRHADSGAWAAVVLSVLAFGAAAAAATWLYRKTHLRSAWLLTAPVLLALAFVLAETLARLLPAWA